MGLESYGGQTLPTEGKRQADVLVRAGCPPYEFVLGAIRPTIRCEQMSHLNIIRGLHRTHSERRLSGVTLASHISREVRDDREQNFACHCDVFVWQIAEP